MGFRFRRSIRIAPGIRWNIGKRSSSLSIGRRGATLNVSSHGTRATVGIPGTGLSYSTPVARPHRSPSIETPSSIPSAEARRPVRFHHVVVLLAFGILLWTLFSGINPTALAVALLGLLYGWSKRRKEPGNVVEASATTVEDDFEKFAQRDAVILSAARMSTTKSAGAVMTRQAQRERQMPTAPREVLGDGVGYELGIVGESHYTSELRALGERRSDAHVPLEFVATLLREPANPYDPNAIVVLSDRGNVIGYLSREDAIDYRPVLLAVEARKKTAQCRAKLIGGTPEKPNIGVWLDIDPPRELLVRLQAADQPF